MLKLVEYILGNPKWETDLALKPYCIKIKRKDNFIMFNYNQIESNFSHELVRECRGIILEDVTFKPVCVPFFKFFNYGEKHSADIDWSSAKVEEKVDGSLIKMWYYDSEWRISTNGTIDANDAQLSSDVCDYLGSFEDLFMVAINDIDLTDEILNKNYTYMFELISPINRIVVPYSSTSIVHIGTRNNETLEEIDVDIGVKKPKRYNLRTLEDCIETATQMPFSEEGYVVVDKNYNRIKIKSPAYVTAHYLKNNNVITKSRIIDVMKIQESSEFLNYFPEYKKAFWEIEKRIETFISIMDEKILFAENNFFKDMGRDIFALYAKKTQCPSMMFNWYDGKCEDARIWLWKQRNEIILKLIDKIEV